MDDQASACEPFDNFDVIGFLHIIEEGMSDIGDLASRREEDNGLAKFDRNCHSLDLQLSTLIPKGVVGLCSVYIQ
jgi:hypothetical protein